MRDYDTEAPVVPEKTKGGDEEKEDWKSQGADRAQEPSKRKQRRQSWWKGIKTTTKKWSQKKW